MTYDKVRSREREGLYEPKGNNATSERDLQKDLVNAIASENGVLSNYAELIVARAFHLSATRDTLGILSYVLEGVDFTFTVLNTQPITKPSYVEDVTYSAIQDWNKKGFYQQGANLNLRKHLVAELGKEENKDKSVTELVEQARFLSQRGKYTDPLRDIKSDVIQALVTEDDLNVSRATTIANRVLSQHLGTDGFDVTGLLYSIFNYIEFTHAILTIQKRLEGNMEEYLMQH